MIKSLECKEVTLVLGGSWCGVYCELNDAVLNAISVCSNTATILIAVTDLRRDRILTIAGTVGVAELVVEAITRFVSWCDYYFDSKLKKK